MWMMADLDWIAWNRTGDIDIDCDNLPEFKWR
jgi:hypothetical protein